MIHLGLSLWGGFVTLLWKSYWISVQKIVKLIEIFALFQKNKSKHGKTPVSRNISLRFIGLLKCVSLMSKETPTFNEKSDFKC